MLVSIGAPYLNHVAEQLATARELAIVVEVDRLAAALWVGVQVAELGVVPDLGLRADS